MDKLLFSIRKAMQQSCDLPFSVYSSVLEQQLHNVPISKPLLIVVLSGDKQLGGDNKINCPADHFIFLSDSPAINMRNIPKAKLYFALLIEFDYQDFEELPIGEQPDKEYFADKVPVPLRQSLQQFVECSSWANQQILSLRKREILALLYHLGYQQVAMMRSKNKVSHRLHELFTQSGFKDLSTTAICEKLAMSESTLRRKLKLEGSSVQAIKDRSRMSLALHLLQTSVEPIGLIAEQCGYHSQSRFTDKFKAHFGLTPRELRKTRMNE